MTCAKGLEEIIHLPLELLGRFAASDAIPFGFNEAFQFDAVESRIVELFCECAPDAIQNREPLLLI